MATFRVQMSDVMDPVLEAKYPEIRTFTGQGISDPRATITLDYNLNGVHAMILTPLGDYFIDPAQTGNTNDYIVYYKKDEIKQDAQLISQHFGNVGDKVIGKVTILDCFFSQKWQCFYVTGSYGTNMVMWASSKELKAGTEHTFTGRIKRHRDNNITQLNFVRIT